MDCIANGPQAPWVHPSTARAGNQEIRSRDRVSNGAKLMTSPARATPREGWVQARGAEAVPGGRPLAWLVRATTWSAGTCPRA